MPSANIASYSSNGATGVIGHYTQVVWAESYALGCGYVYFNDGQWYTRVNLMHISINLSNFSLLKFVFELYPEYGLFYECTNSFYRY